MEQIVKNHKEKTTFEDFVTSVFSPTPLANLFHTDLYSSRPSSVASTSNFSTDTIAAEAADYRPRARTDASALSSSSTTTLTLDSCDGQSDLSSANSPKNLKKLTAAIRANINNNVARVGNHRPREDTTTTSSTVAGSTSGLMNHANSSPPLSATGNSSTKKR